MKILLTLVLASVVGLSSAFAAKDYKWMTGKELQKAKKMAVKRGKRKIASEDAISDDAMSEEFRKFRDKFLTIIKKEEVEAHLQTLEKNYDSYPDDLKFFAAQMIPFLNFKSMAYRLYPLVKKVKVTHSAVLTRVLNFASFMRINLPTTQWEAGFRFASEPFTGDQDRFESAEELQAFTENTIYPSLMKAAQRLQALDFSGNKVVWDHKLFYGTASFTDNFKRYRYVGEAERIATLASLHEGMAWIKRFSAYSVKGSMKLAKDLGVLVGVDSFFSKVDGVSAQKVTSVFNNDEHKGLYILQDGGKEKIQVAFNHLKEAARLQVIAWHEVKDRPANELDAMNSIILDPFRDRIDRGSETLEKMVAGPTIIRSDVTGELVKVDLPAFYANPPKDLKSLLPNEFRGGDKTIKKKLATKSGKTKRVKFRNYFYGSAVGWDINSYKSLFPEIKDGRDIAKAARILNQSAGTFPVAMGVNAAMVY